MYDVTCHLLLNILIALDVWLNQVSATNLNNVKANNWIWTWKREKRRNETKSVKSFVFRLRKNQTTKSIRIELNRMQYNFDSSLNQYLVYENVTFVFVWMIIVTAIHWDFMIYLMFGKAIYGIKSNGICQTKSFQNGKNTRLNHPFFRLAKTLKVVFSNSSRRDSRTECIPIGLNLNHFKVQK